MSNMKKVILFPGQGSQYRGMGKKLFPKYAQQTRIASDILGYDLEELCVKDPNKQLRQTQFTQPALYVVNHFLQLEQAQAADFYIGHSLGEYNALLAGGAFDFEMGLRLVQKRGALMAAASGGSMAAVLGLQIEELEAQLKKGSYTDIDIANYNTPTQIVLSGKKEAIERIIKDFTEQEIRIVPLNVSAPFHSRYMQPAAAQFATFLKDFNLYPLKTPVIANVTARPYENNQIANLLSQQIASSVRWTDTIRYLMGQEVAEYQELGRGILTKMANEIRKTCTPIKEIIIPDTNGQIEKAKKEVIAPSVNSTVVASPPKTTPEKSVSPKSVATKTNGIRKKGKLSLANKLGNADFRKDYGIDYAYIAGAMYRGIASKELVIRMAGAKLLSFLGTAGMSLEEIGHNIDAIQRALPKSVPYGMNLIHDLTNPAVEMQTVELFLEKGIQNIEAAAFMQMTESLVCFHAKGLKKDTNGTIIRQHRILAKVSRPEVAEAFMRPAPEKLLNRLIEEGKITEEQAVFAKNIPVSYDICVEADSGGHTDAGVAMVLLPSIQRLARDIQTEYQYSSPIRVGLAGGIGTPQSAAAAFVMGADFILTGSINQCTIEAGTSDVVKDLLAGVNVQDTAYAPASDMFEIGAKVQVLRKGVLFPARANKLYNLYNQYDSLEAIPIKTIQQIEKNYFKKTLTQVWQETKTHLQNTGRATEIQKAERTPKHKMALVFRRYFGYSSRMAFAGDMEHKVNFQIHTGPALGAFNQWVKGTTLESWRNRHVEAIGIKLMEETADLLQNRLKNMLQ